MDASNQVHDSIDPELRAATIAVLRERGFDGLTLEHVAAAAGRARTTLWRQGVTIDGLIGALTGELDADFRASMYPVLTSGGSGLERLERGLAALCALIDRHLPLLLATDEAFHQQPAPGQQPDYLHPFITFVGDGVADGSLAPTSNPVETADVLFNAVAWPYVHLRGRHGWSSKKAARLVVGLVLRGVVAAERGPTSKRKDRS